jgi:hypothetical protein
MSFSCVAGRWLAALGLSSSGQAVGNFPICRHTVPAMGQSPMLGLNDLRVFAHVASLKSFSAIGSYSGPSSFGAPSRSFMKSTNARTLGESSRLLANTMLTSTGGIDQSGNSGTSCPQANSG